jgi:Transposase
MARQLAITISRHTLIRRVRALPEPDRPAGPQVLGVDDVALRKGHVYGTLLVDMSTRRPIDLLAERTSEPLAAWLRAHPGVAVICRDRAGAYAYAEGARLGAPDAIQVADRFHLWQNLGQAVEHCVIRHRRCLTAPAATQPANSVREQPDAPETAEATGRFAQRARAHHALVHDLPSQGHGIRAIAAHLGWGRHTVQRYARAATWQDMVKGQRTPRASKLDPFKTHLHQRWQEGCTNILALHREITALGFTGDYSIVRRYLSPLRRVPTAPPPAPPSVRRVAGWLTRHPDTLGDDERRALAGVLGHCRHLHLLRGHVAAFAAMMGNLDGHLLDEWITAASAADLPDLAAFARGLLQDRDAVTHALTLPYSSGTVEGHVNRIKMLKRQMYGRANLDLLRNASCSPDTPPPAPLQDQSQNPNQRLKLKPAPPPGSRRGPVTGPQPRPSTCADAHLNAETGPGTSLPAPPRRPRESP